MSEKTIEEQFYSQVSESIKMVVDLSSRIDERVKMLIDEQKALDKRVDKLVSLQNELIARVSVLEAKDVTSIKHDVHNVSQRVAVLESLPGQQIPRIDDLEDDVKAIEVKMESLSLRTASSEGKWAKIIDFALKLGWAILAGYILYRLGFPEPL